MTYDVILFTDLAGKYYHTKPLGAYRLATELRSHGYSVKVIDFSGNWLSNIKMCLALLESIIGNNTLFIGFSSTFFGVISEHDISVKSGHFTGLASWSSAYPCSAQKFEVFLATINKKWPHVSLVYGGSNVSLQHQLSDRFNFVVAGLADKVIIDLTNHLKNQTPLKFNRLPEKKFKYIDYDVKGLSFDFANSKTIFEECDQVVPGELLPLETSRGCMFKCKFCSFPLLGRKKTDPAYQKTHECLTAELKHNWDRWQVKKYAVIDDTFNEMTSKLTVVHRAIQEANIDIEFFAYIRLDLLHAYPEQIPLLRDMGLRSAYFGIESLNTKSAMAIGKGITRENIIKTLELCQRHWGDQVSMHANLIAGLPHETPETLDKTMTWFHSDASPVDSVHLSCLHLFDSTNIWSSEFESDPKKHGYTLTPSQGWKNNIWDKEQCQVLCQQYNDRAYSQGINKISNWDIMAIQNLGYEFDDLKGVALKDLPWKSFETKCQEQFINYAKSVFAYESIQYDFG
jgi:hypothetical protein